MLSRLGLGTAQFGWPYGVSNKLGKPNEGEVAAILQYASEAGIGYLDTASTYGNAEALVGRYLPRHHPFRIVIKVPPIVDDKIDTSHRKVLLDVIETSLDRLKVERVHAILMHAPDDLHKAGWQHLVEALQQAQSNKWTALIGASVYDAGQLSLAFNRMRPQIVQLPLNVLDRRLLGSGWIDRLKDSGAEIHARSVFLQGLLLMDPSALPQFFAPISEHIRAFRTRWKELGVPAIIACLSFVLQQRGIDAVIVGVNQRAELEEIAAGLASAEDKDGDLESTVELDDIYVDPRRWPAFAQ